MSMIKIFFPPKLKYGSSRYFYITLVFNFCIDERKLMCSILKLVRTHFAACGGEEVPPRKFGKAAEPHR